MLANMTLLAEHTYPSIGDGAVYGRSGDADYSRNSGKGSMLYAAAVHMWEAFCTGSSAVCVVAPSALVSKNVPCKANRVVKQLRGQAARRRSRTSSTAS